MLRKVIKWLDGVYRNRKRTLGTSDGDRVAPNSALSRRQAGEYEDSDASPGRETRGEVVSFVEDFAAQSLRQETICSPRPVSQPAKVDWRESMSTGLEQICRNLVTQVQGAVAFGVVDLDTAMLLGEHHTVTYFSDEHLQAVAAASVEMFSGKTAADLQESFRQSIDSDEVGDNLGAEGTPYFDEVSVSTTDTFHFMKVLPGESALAVLVTSRTANQGLCWFAIRGVGDQLAAELPGS